MERLQGKVAIVTGAAGGIGSATAERLVREGAQVLLADRDAAALGRTRARLGGQSSELATDVTDDAHMDRLVSTALERYGPRRHRRAQRRNRRQGRSARQGIDSELRHGLRGECPRRVRGTCHAPGDVRRERRRFDCRDLFLRWIARRASLAVYSASKHAVLGLVKSAALEGAPRNIRVNAIAPGPVDTRMLSAIEQQSQPDDPASARSAVLAGVPLKRCARPSEMAAMIAFLASDDASYCTGAVFSCDGGRQSLTDPQGTFPAATTSGLLRLDASDRWLRLPHLIDTRQPPCPSVPE